MGENDITLVTLLEDEARYADLVNAVLAEGRPVVLPEHICEADPSARSVIQRLWKRVPVQKNRDSIRKIVMGMQVILIGVEHQCEVHYAMPARVMMYDALHYDRQLGKLKRFHKRRRDLKGSEFLSGFARTDKLVPVFTIVLYWGEEPWDGPRDLWTMLDCDQLPENAKKLVNNYPLHLIEVRRFPHPEWFRTDLRLVFQFLQRASDKNALLELVQREEFTRLEEDLFHVLALFGDMSVLIDQKEALRTEGGKIDMCKGMRDLLEDSKAAGIDEGLTRVNKLNQLLAAQGRTEDIIKAAGDARYQERLFKEFGM